MPSTEDPFYVGYLPTPRPHKRFARLALLILLPLAAASGAALGWLMDRPGDGVWDTTSTATATGTLRLEPVPFVQTADGPVLLVEEGKFGARDLSAVGDGSTVEVRGSLLSRGSLRMIELAPGEAAITSVDGVTTSHEASAARDVEIAGEIVDSKCFLGAMKPGDGRTHAACARLCIRGGIPAAVVGTIDGEPMWAVIDPGESPVIGDDLLAAVGEPVRIRGTLGTVHGLPVLRSASLLDNAD